MKTKTAITTITAHLPLAVTFCCALIAGLLVAGCAKRGSTVNNTTSAGTYTLVSVNGKPVPAEVTHHGAALKVRSGTFTINADGTCSTKTVFVPPSGKEVTRIVDATYSSNGSKLTMQWKGAGRTTGTIEGNTFTMDNEGMIFVYSRL